MRVRQVEPEVPCVCQRLLSCWGTPDEVNALYATVDISKKNNRNTNYANLPTGTTASNSNYENMDFAQSLQLYENARQVAQKAGLCTKCGHAQDDYLMMEPAAKTQQPHPGYLPMSPAVKQRLCKNLSSSNPNLGSQKPSGSSMLHANIYQRKQLLDSTDNIDPRRRRSNSADSSSQETENSSSSCTCRRNSISSKPQLENSQENEPTPCSCRRGSLTLPKVTNSPNQEAVPVTTCPCQAAAVRRSSSVPCKANRDSSSSNDSGVFELPRKQQILVHATLPRRSKSSDPLRDLSFHFQKQDGKSASAEAEVPVCPSGSTSSGTSDMSDYIETLSLSSHSSGEAALPPPSCTLRPRSGNEYLSLQRLIVPVPEERHN